MKKTIGNILLIVWYASLAFAYVNGLFHSFKKHGTGDGIIGAVLFPWAMYRGVEMFWHNDYPNKDWDKQLKIDMTSCVYFFNQSNAEDQNIYQTNTDMLNFSEDISKYPSDKLDYLKKGCKLYAQLGISILEDTKKCIDKLNTEGTFKYEFGSSTLKIQDELVIKYGMTEMKQLTDSAMTIWNEVSFADMDEDGIVRINAFARTIPTLIESHKNSYGKCYETIFNEKLSL